MKSVPGPYKVSKIRRPNGPPVAGSFRFSIVIAIGCMIGLAGHQANADLVHYTDVTADTVMFTSIVETSTNSGPVYGQPTPFADSIIMPGTGMLTQALGGSISMVNGRLQMTVSAADGFEFDSINILQLGSFLNFGDEAISMFNSSAMVFSDGSTYTGNMNIPNMAAGPGMWGGDYTISFPSTTEATLTLNSQLLASAGLTSASFIESSLTQISVNGSQSSVPEPSAFLMLGVASIWIRPRRKRRD